MDNQLAVLISSFFLLMTDLVLLRYLWRKLGLRRGHIPINAGTFLFCSLSILALTGLFAGILGPQNIMLATALGMGVLFSLIHPVMAICFFVSFLLLRPMEMMPLNILTYSITKILAVLNFLSWAISGVRRRKILLASNLNSYLFAGLVFWLIGSAAFCRAPDTALAFLASNFIPITAVSLLIANVLRDENDLAALRSVLIVSILGVVLSAVYISLTRNATAVEPGRLESVTSFGNANDLAALIVLVIPFCAIPVITKATSFLRRMALGLVCCVFLYGLIFCASRGAMLSVGIGVIIYIAVALPSRLKIALLLPALLAPVVLLGVIHRNEADLSESTDLRQTFFLNGLRMAKANPLFGVGITQYPEYGAALGQIRATAHSSWVLILAEAGFAGFGFFFGLFLATVACAWKIRKLAPEFLVSVVSYGIAISFLSHTYLFLPYVLWSFVLAAWLVYRKAVPGEVRVAAAGKI